MESSEAIKRREETRKRHDEDVKNACMFAKFACEVSETLDDALGTLVLAAYMVELRREREKQTAKKQDKIMPRRFRQTDRARN